MSQTRRNFLKNTALVSSIPMMSSFTALAENPVKIKAKAGFQLLFMQTDWGFGGSTEEFCAATKKEGYDGIEVWWPGDDKAPALFEAIKKYGLQVGFLCAGYQSNPKEHLATFKTTLDKICANKFQKPVYINCHSGRDHFSYDENKAIIDYVESKAKSSGIPIYHETHRSRMMFAAHVTKNFAEKSPNLRLTLDISHWCNVHETLLEDQKETVDYLLNRVDHIHSRIGHPEGPQVNDPRAPEWENVVKAHLAWWDKVIERKKKNGEVMTILTEFGPIDYMPALPYTRQPLADQWAINVYMKNLLKKRYL